MSDPPGMKEESYAGACHHTWGWNRIWLLGLLLLVVSLTEFVVRGPVRFALAGDFNDFKSPYIQTRAWMKGIDPYSPANLVALWPDTGQRLDFLKRDMADGSLVLKHGIPTAYPPTSFALLAPIAWLPYRVAHPAWLLISLFACVLAVVSLALRAQLRWPEKRTYLFLAFAFALAPFHTGLGAGSLVIVAVAACALAVWAIDRQQDLIAGILIGVAVGLKPQIGLPFLVYYLLRRRWRVVGVAVTLVALLAAIAILHLSLHHTPWIDNYRNDNKILFARGSLGDFTEENPIRFSLINLQVLLYTFKPDRTAATFLALAISGAMGVLWLVLLRRRDHSETELLELSALCLLSLLPVYHRLYDASLLIFPLAWSMTALSGPLKRWAKGTLFLMLVFLVPGGSALERLQYSNYLPRLQHSWWWFHFALPHQVWILILLTALLLHALRMSPTPSESLDQSLRRTRVGGRGSQR